LTTPALPDLVKQLASNLPMPIQRMSPEHLFLRCTSTLDQRPHALGWILERGRRAYPDCAHRLQLTEHVRRLCCLNSRHGRLRAGVA